MDSEHIIITLYIRADRGPISPMTLDMLEVEIAVVSLPASADRDEARVREIANRIKKHYPNVEPDRKLQELRWLIGRLKNIAMFDGIVLRLPGSIDGPAQPKNPLVAEFEKLSTESLELKRKFTTIEQERDALQDRKDVLEAECIRLKVEPTQLKKEVRRLRTELDDVEEKEEIARTDGLRYKEKANKLEQEMAILQTQLDRAKVEQQTLRRAQQEVGTLREQLKNAADTEQQLRTRIKKLELELTEMKDRIRRLAENASPAKADQASNPWLD